MRNQLRDRDRFEISHFAQPYVYRGWASMQVSANFPAAHRFITPG
jgi:hypothetical protein